MGSQWCSCLAKGGSQDGEETAGGEAGSVDGQP